MPEVKGGRDLNTFLGTHGSNYLKINGKNRHVWFVCRNNSRSKCQYLTYTLFSVSQRITKQGNVFCRPPRARIPGQRCGPRASPASVRTALLKWPLPCPFPPHLPRSVDLKQGCQWLCGPEAGAPPCKAEVPVLV